MVKVYVLKFTKVWYKKAKYSRWVLNVHSEVTVFAYTMTVRGTLLKTPPAPSVSSRTTVSLPES